MAVLTDAEFLALAVASESLTGVDSGVRDAHRKAASADVRSAACKRYDAATIDAAITADDDAAWIMKARAADIGGFTLVAHRGVSQQDSTYQIIKDRHDVARKWLADLIAGDVELPGVDPTRGGPQVANGATPRWRSDWTNGIESGCLPYPWLDS